MASLNEQILERKKRLQALAQKASIAHGETLGTPSERVETSAASEFKRIKKDAEVPNIELSASAQEPASVKPETMASVGNERFDIARKPTSDLEDKLRPDLEELEERTQEAIKRLVRQRLLTQDVEAENN
ncbi:LANO_0E08570g1_1 [Lachancea nothofagi CBS 11611]|uniref:LANO_0E08570g1_1 n=1 Tax=Lachancea nothofagi CBS 11611 TaxID=1266666 RepID=A0A1G4JV64_9SACH|nr:LANO_0E08570g1_1 [Lachancea nothofagi CBS 11611]